MYPADPDILGDTDEFASRDKWVFDMLYANWVENNDGSPYTVDERMGVGGSPGDERYIKFTGIFNGGNRYVLFDCLLKEIIKVKRGDGSSIENSEIGFELPRGWTYPIAVYCEYVKDIAIGNILGELGVSQTHGNVSESVYKVTKLANFNHRDGIDTVNECRGKCFKF
jgi:hypothetical protein